MPAPSSHTPIFSVIIATRNRHERLLMCLHEYARQTSMNFEIIVVDNGSTDETASMMEREFKDVDYLRYVCLPNNIGPYALNLAASMAQGEYLWRTDDDAHPYTTDLFERMEAYVRTYPHVDVLAGDVYENAWGREHAWYTRDVDKVNVPGEGYPTRLFNGCATCFRKSLFDKLGGFWDVFYLEEQDLGVRALMNGATMRYHPHFKTHHYSATTSADMSVRWKVMSTQIVRYHVKYMPLHIAFARWLFIVPFQMVQGLYHRLPLKLLLEGYWAMLDMAMRTRRIERMTLTPEQRRTCMLETSFLNDNWRYIKGVIARRRR